MRKASITTYAGVGIQRVRNGEIMPNVLNKYRDEIPKDAVYIGRPSPYGNPFSIGEDGTRSEVIEKYRLFVNKNPELQTLIQQNLRGKDLVCFCAPKPCHGDIILSIANF
jgi:hypothetical protein